MKKQGFNPYLPSWEYVPDGEPYVFGGRVYVYGSHDRFDSDVFCLDDYVCWSAPVTNLGDWRCEGTIYRKTDDPLNPSGDMCLYAPDITVGPDGRYYLYYVLDKVSIVSVAVCDTPDGSFSFYGYVHYKDGTRLGEKKGDEPQFDPGVITENGKTWLYTGFCPKGDKSRTGPMATLLDSDMLTIINPPKTILPSEPYNHYDTSYKGHEFFEAPSIRKRGDTYYLIYSSIVFHELCYAVSKSPDKDFVYKGVIVSNCDAHISSYKPADMSTYYGGNNHGSIVEINGEWYIFYHRHTNASWFCRQACLEKIYFSPDGTIKQVEITSSAPNGGPLEGEGFYPGYIACNLFTREEHRYSDIHNGCFPFITQDWYENKEGTGYIANMMDGTQAGFKYFDCAGVKKLTVHTRGYCNGEFLVKTAWDGPVLGRIKVEFTNVWKPFTAEVKIPDGVNAIYLEYSGGGRAALHGFTLEK